MIGLKLTPTVAIRKPALFQCQCLVISRTIRECVIRSFSSILLRKLVSNFVLHTRPDCLKGQEQDNFDRGEGKHCSPLRYRVRKEPANFSRLKSSHLKLPIVNHVSIDYGIGSLGLISGLMLHTKTYKRLNRESERNFSRFQDDRSLEPEVIRSAQCHF